MRGSLVDVGKQSEEPEVAASGDRASYQSPTVTAFGNVRDILRGAAEGSIDDGAFAFKRGSEE